MNENESPGHAETSRPAHAPGIGEGEEFFTQIVDLHNWFATDLSETGSFDIGAMAATTFGKLLDALPIPALLVDGEYKVAYANRACHSMSDGQNTLIGLPFQALVPKTRNAEKARTLINKVFLTRNSVVADAILEIDARKIWGRLYFRSVRVGGERFVLLIVEDHTSEKTRLVLRDKSDNKQKAQREELARIVYDRTRRLTQTSEKLCEEVFKHEQTEGELRLEEDRFNKLAELVPHAVAVLKNTGAVQRLNSTFKEWFGPDICDDPSGPDAATSEGHEDIMQHLAKMCDSDSTDVQVRNLHFKQGDTDYTVTCKSVRLANGDFLVVCDR